MIRYQLERWQDAESEMAEHFSAHCAEVGADPGRFTLSPDYAMFRALQDSGNLAVITARDDGRLVGYHVSLVRRHMHYDSLTAYTDIFYIAPPYRKGMIGVKLFKAAEDVLTAMGVERIYTGTKLKLDIGPILERLGYNAIERLYTKVTHEKVAQ